MVSARLSHLLWNSLQCMASSLWDVCQASPHEKQKCHNNNNKKIQQPEMTPEWGISDPTVFFKQ